MILFLFCACHRDEPVGYLAERIAKRTVSCLDKYGYNSKNKYILAGPYTVDDNEFPAFYELKINGTTEYYVTCEYCEEIPIGGLWEQYENGYISVNIMTLSYAKEIGFDLSIMKKGNQKINLKDYLLFAKAVVIEDDSAKPVNDELLEKMIDSTVTKALSYGKDVNISDTVSIIGPVSSFSARYDADKILHLNMVEMQYLGCLNGKAIFVITVDLANNSCLFSPLDENNDYDLLVSSGTRFLLVQGTIISENMKYDENMVPAKERESFRKAQEYLNSIAPYTTVNERIVTELPE